MVIQSYTITAARCAPTTIRKFMKLKIILTPKAKMRITAVYTQT